MDKPEACPFCEQQASQQIDQSRNVVRYDCDCCGEFHLEHPDYQDWRDSGRKKSRPKRICALLVERRLKELPAPFLLFRDRKEYDIGDRLALHITDLLTTWPEWPPERIDRCLCNLARKAPKAAASITVGYRPPNYLFFTDDAEEGTWFRRALKQRNWIEYPRGESYTSEMVLTPQGWARIQELEGGIEKKRNPAFVAMCFGKKEEKEKRAQMDQRWLEVLRPAIEAAGYHAKRADTDKHNDPIMDRLIEDIRRAPFVVAELSDDNNGVYYEAGFAKGRGIEVIHCCKDGHKPHFDVTGINLVFWQDEDDLRRRLEDRILGSRGKGPYDF